jgi:hypothetical protein
VLVHAIFEGFAAVDEDDGDFVGELAAELVVGVDVDFLPDKATAAVEFGERFFDDLAKVAAFASVEHDLTGIGHGASLAEMEQASSKPSKRKGQNLKHRGHRGTQRKITVQSQHARAETS